MGDFFSIIHSSLPIKIIGIAIIIWAFYTLIRHPDRVLFDVMMHKKKVKYDESEREKKSDFDSLMAEEIQEKKATE